MFGRVLGKKTEQGQTRPGSPLPRVGLNRDGAPASSERTIKSWGIVSMGTSNSLERETPANQRESRRFEPRLFGRQASDLTTTDRKLSMSYLLRKSKSQPNLTASPRSLHEQPLPRRQSPRMPQPQKKREDERGFLDRAFENAASLSFEDDFDAGPVVAHDESGTKSPRPREQSI